MEEKNKEMEEAVIEWMAYKFEMANKENWAIVFDELESNKKASDLLVHLINDTQNSFFKLGKQVARMEMEQ